MTVLTLMTYNIEHMRDLFFKGNFAPDKMERIDAIASVIGRETPHLLGITEACYRETSHTRMIEHPDLRFLSFQVARSHNRRGSHDLVIYYRKPFSLVALDETIDFYDNWIEDIDDDGIKEVCEFERMPLEAEFRIDGTNINLMVILISLKSKGVFAVRDFLDHQNLSLANRKRQLAQARKIRKRLDVLMASRPRLPIIVMGDFNDEPGMDSFQRMLGASSVETIMGSVFCPRGIFHNVLWHMQATRKKDLWTSQYPDLIVKTDQYHRAWLDHILLSPCLVDPSATLQYIADSGDISEKNDVARLASDHFPVQCRLQLTQTLP